MSDRYSRNRIYLNCKDQLAIRECPIILGGSGIGSVIAECALRLGFENITIIDGDQVELSNLNRQNYTSHDVKVDKAIAIKNRLLAINSEAKITVHNEYLTAENIGDFIDGHQIAINALDFSSDVPLVFDEVCQKKNIPILHPYNLGWGGLVAVVMPDGMSLDGIRKPFTEFNEVNMVDYVINYLKFWNLPYAWIEEILSKYKEEEHALSPPQLSVASWFVAAMCTHLLFNLATKKEIKSFPEFYLSTIMN